MGLALDQIKAEEGVTFEVPGLGKRTIGKDRIIITGPPTVFDINNIDEYNF